MKPYHRPRQFPAALHPLLAAILFAAIGCGKMKMPDIQMPDALREEKPEVMVQQHIAAVTRAGDDLRFFREVAGLIQVAQDVNWDNRRLLAEVADYATRLDAKPETIARYNRLLTVLQIPRETVVSVAAPRLENATGTPAEAARALLRSAAPPDLRGKIDFSHFTQYLSFHQAQPPEKLVLWMYQIDPAGAMWEMMAVYARNPQDKQAVAASEHVISEILFRQQTGLLKPDELNDTVLQHLEKLAVSPDWYVRLYAVHIMAKYPRLRKAELASRLAQDDNKLVKTAAAWK